MLSFVMKTLTLVFISTAVMAHEMTPTYFKATPSVYADVYETQLTLLNRREEQLYYEISVFDEDFNPVPFAAKSRLLKIPTYKREEFTLYFRNFDLSRVVYVCTESKTPKGQLQTTGVTSRICSKRIE